MKNLTRILNILYDTRPQCHALSMHDNINDIINEINNHINHAEQFCHKPDGSLVLGIKDTSCQ